jgi:IS30 family transposase
MQKKDIAAAINVNPSTITREIKRNSGSNGRYNWETAQKNATYHKHRNPGNHAVKLEIKEKSLKLLADEQWSPEQISGFLAKDGIHISHETIYRIIRHDKANGGDLFKNCRHQMKHRARPVGERRFSIPNRTSISQRPKEADGTRFGDFEMDTIVGKNNRGAIVTLTERSTNLLLMRKLTCGKTAKECAETVVHLLEPFKPFIKSITTDNGTEFTRHDYITKKLGVTVYFADPHAPWQKGAIENINGLIRQYIPNGTDFKQVSQQKISAIQDRINRRPREKINFSTPMECFYEKIS